MLLKFCFILALITFVNSKYVDYKGHKVYKITPTSKSDVNILKNVKNGNEHLFWTDEEFGIGREVRIQVAPENQEKFEKYLSEVNINVSRVIEDVQSLIDEQRKRPSTFKNIADYAWDHYQTLDEIYEWLDLIEATYPDIAKIITIGTTYNGRPIKGIVIDFKKNQKSTNGVMEGGIHAREWISTATLTWVIKEFLTSTDPDVRAMAEDVTWHIFPVMNPDGYDYTFTTNRMWKKNRNPANYTSCAPWNVRDDMSNGVDLNRNFDFHWNTVGASSNSCTENFAGPSAFSEAESAALSSHIDHLKNHGKVLYFFSFHSFKQLLLLPFSHASGSEVVRTPYYGDMFEISSRGVAKLTARHGSIYNVGTSADLLHAVSGSAFDWAKGVAEIPMAFQFKLRDLGDYGVLLPAHNIKPNGEETVDALAEMHKIVIQLGHFRRNFGCNIVSSVVMMIVAIFTLIVLK